MQQAVQTLGATTAAPPETVADIRPVDVADIVLSVHRDPREIEAVWRDFERSAVRSIYQRYDWIGAWCEHAAPAQKVEPAIVLGLHRGQPLFILPLGRQRTRLSRVVTFLGGPHVNTAIGLWDPSFLRMLTPAAAQRLLDRVVAALPRTDFLALCTQPFVYEGAVNPLQHVRGRVDDQPLLVIPLAADFDTVLKRSNGARKKKKMRWQENTLAPVGGYRFKRAENPADALATLAAFLGYKGDQFARSGIDNVFAEPGTADFFRGLVERSFAHGESLIELYDVEIEGRTRATFAGGVDGDRFCGYFSAIALDDYQRVSPGDLLLFNLVRECCRRGHRLLDFGVGEERYKASWEAAPQPQFSTYVGVTLRGKAVAGILRRMQATRMRIRGNPRAWARFKKVRRFLAGLTGQPPAGGDATTGGGD